MSSHTQRSKTNIINRIINENASHLIIRVGVKEDTVYTWERKFIHMLEIHSDFFKQDKPFW